MPFKSVCYEYIEYVYQNSYADLHIKAGLKATYRAHGELINIDDYIIDDDDIISFCNDMIDDFDPDDTVKSIDFSFSYKDCRFRANLYHDANGYSLALRLLKLFSTDFDVLKVPNQLKDLAEHRSGLILITGPTGSGKSTTMAALVNYLNNNKQLHIITIEDPLEFTFKSEKSIVSQRQVGKDTKTFERALAEAMRQDPDVIVIGEIRDMESCEACLRAAETGHLVISTLHTRSAAATITRIIDMFQIEQQGQILNQLSSCLLGICSQQLLPSINNDRMYLASELLVNSPAIANNIKQNKINMIANMMEISNDSGMYLMKKSIERLYNDGCISAETKIKYSL